MNTFMRRKKPNTIQKNNQGDNSEGVAKGLDEAAWRRAPLFGKAPLKGIDVDVLNMMHVALEPGLGVGNRRRILRAATAFSNAATAAFKLDPLVKTPFFKNPSCWSGRESSGSPA